MHVRAGPGTAPILRAVVWIAAGVKRCGVWQAGASAGARAFDYTGCFRALNGQQST